MQSDTSHVGHGTPHGFLQCELLAHITGSEPRVQAALLARHQTVQTYPASCPVAFLQQSYAEALLLAPGRLADGGPQLDLPRALHGTLQGLTLIAHPQLPVALDTARVPELVAPVVSHHYLIGGLADILLVGEDEPREAWLGRVDAQGLV